MHVNSGSVWGGQVFTGTDLHCFVCGLLFVWGVFLLYFISSRFLLFIFSTHKIFHFTSFTKINLVQKEIRFAIIFLCVCAICFLHIFIVFIIFFQIFLIRLFFSKLHLICLVFLPSLINPWFFYNSYKIYNKSQFCISA